jgi:hypothetical protein
MERCVLLVILRKTEEGRVVWTLRVRPYEVVVLSFVYVRGRRVLMRRSE